MPSSKRVAPPIRQAMLINNEARKNLPNAKPRQCDEAMPHFQGVGHYWRQRRDDGSEYGREYWCRGRKIRASRKTETPES